MRNRRLLLVALLLMATAVSVYREYQRQRAIVLEFEEAKQLSITCKLDMALDREKYSIRSKNPDTSESLLALKNKLAPDENWIAIMQDINGKFYFAGHHKWRNNTYETFIWLCESKEDAEMHFNFFMKIVKLRDLEFKSYNLVN